MSEILRDLRFGIRTLARSPVTSSVILAMLAIAISANTVVFSVVYAKFLRPLPFTEPERLVQVWEVSAALDYRPSTISPFNYLDWKESNRTLEDIAVYTRATHTLATEEGPRRMIGARVTASFFPLLGVPPRLGSLPGEEHDRPGSDVAVLAHDTWQERFAADPEIVGTTLNLDGRPYTVLAVMPEEFRFPAPSVEVWTTPAFDLMGFKRSDHFLFGLARIEEGVSLEEAQEDMSSVAARLEEIYPGTNEDSDVLLESLSESMVGSQRAELLILWGGVALVLIVACANLANLLLARILARREEVAMRIALGGSRWRIVRQLMTENLVLASLGGVLALGLTLWTTRLLASGYGPRILRTERIEVDLWVFGFGVIVTLLTALLFGIAPALRAGRTEVRAHLGSRSSEGLSTGRRHMVPKIIIAFQVALAVVLLVAAGLLGKSLLLLQRIDVGFDPQGAMTLRLAVPGAVYESASERANLYRRVVERVEAVPGVRGAAGVNDLPLSGSRTQRAVEIVGRPKDPQEPTPSVDYRTVVGDYFQVLGLDVDGETFDTRYGPESPRVAVVNEAFRDDLLHKGRGVRDRLRLGRREFRVIGVVENLRHEGPSGQPFPEVYVPMEQGEPPEWLYIVLRSDLPPETLTPMLVRSVSEILPDYPLYGFQSLEARLGRITAPQRFNSLIFTLFAVFAVILVLLGIYGLISFTERERTREIAVRIALGGTRGAILRLMVLHGLVPTAAGVLLGLLVSFPLARLLRSLLFGVEPLDPYVLVLAPLLMALLAALASFIPARKAMSLDPAAALRRG